MSKIELYNDDCFEKMKSIPEHSIDCIMTDMLYNITACDFEYDIDLKQMWELYLSILKEKGTIILTANQPFTSKLVMSNYKMFKYELIWDKVKAVGMQYARFRPMSRHETILIFGNGRITYNPNYERHDKKTVSRNYSKISSQSSPLHSNDGKRRVYFKKNPQTIIRLSNAFLDDRCHPTQKPISLMEYLIKQYTNENDIVLDPFMGSGTTGVACKELNRNFIGIEKDVKYYELAKNRIDAVKVTEKYW